VPGVVYRDYRLALGGELFEHAADLLLPRRRQPPVMRRKPAQCV
jgi:hypothetical protein